MGFLGLEYPRKTPTSLLVDGINPPEARETHVKRLGKWTFLTKWSFWSFLAILDESTNFDDS